MNISVIKDENGVLMMNPKAAARKQSEMVEPCLQGI